MTKKQFKKSLLCGHGRCIIATRENPEKYRELILWACTHNLSFDTQCEGARAWYVYQLISCYENQVPFIEKIAEALKKYRSNWGWNLQYLSELLQLFALDGNEFAQKALKSKYEQLYSLLMAKKKCPNRIFYERDDFEFLCITLSSDKQALFRIAEDIGRLLLSKSFYDGGDFELHYELVGKKYVKSLVTKAKKSPYIKAYVESQEKYKKECEEWRANNPAPNISRIKTENDDTPKMDLQGIEKLVKSTPVDRNEETDWHSLYLSVLNMAEKGIKIPRWVLEHIYENSYCSCCRENALRQMGKRHMLTEAILQECLFDSNEDIRKYVKKILNNRKNKNTEQRNLLGIDKS